MSRSPLAASKDALDQRNKQRVSNNRPFGAQRGPSPPPPEHSPEDLDFVEESEEGGLARRGLAEGAQLLLEGGGEVPQPHALAAPVGEPRGPQQARPVALAHGNPALDQSRHAHVPEGGKNVIVVHGWRT